LDFRAFGVFIVACGVTHVMEVSNLWHTQYWLAAGAGIRAVLQKPYVPRDLARRVRETLDRHPAKVHHA
jgi:hypothetical protein